MSPQHTSTPFGQWLKRRRRQLRLTQDALAARIGYTSATLQKLEQGVRMPSHTLAVLLADALELHDAERVDFFQLVSEPPAARGAGGRPSPDDNTAAEWHRPLPPAPPTALIGRESERAALAALLSGGRHRLLTLVGPGGAGKTSLALQVAADLATDPAFPDGVAVVLLAGAASAAQACQLIAEALRVPLPEGRPAADQLLDALRDRALLLALDNCEQLLGGGDDTLPALLARLLAGAPRLAVLATSRERLHLRDEHVVALGGLGLPAADSGPRVERAASVQLFLERARRVNPGFAPRASDWAAIAQLCRRLDGMPLAIELAAGWTRALTPGELAAEIDRSLDLLTSDLSDAPARHRSMRATLDHSWRLLDETERRVLARLSVVRGSCDREAAQAVAGATLPILSALIDKSLVRAGAADAVSRYSLHELVRQYAAEQLAADPALRQEAEARHAAYYAGLLQRLVTQQTGGSEPGAWLRLGRDLDNIRAAWTWAAAAGDMAIVRGMARGLMLLYDLYGWRHDAVELFGQAAGALRAFGAVADAARGLATGLQGYFLLLTRPAAAPPLLREGIALLEAAGDDDGRAEMLLHLGTAEVAAADFAAARARYQQAAALAERTGNHFVRLWATFLRGNIEMYTGHLAAAQQCFHSCLAQWRSQGFERGVTTALSGLSMAALRDGRLGDAEAYAQESLRISSTLRDMPGVGRILHDLGALALARGDLNEAYYLLAESCATLQTLGDTWSYGMSRAVLVEVEARRGQIADARKGCAALLLLVRDGLRLFLPDAAYSLALVLIAEGREREAGSVLAASVSAPGRHDVLARIAALRDTLPAQGGPAAHNGAPDADGGEGLLRMLEELCAQPAAGERRPPVVPDGALYIEATGETLSPREVEVLGLLTGGMSNQRIADTLVISLHTAKHHVASVLRKLGVTSRASAAERGRALGLAPRISRLP